MRWLAVAAVAMSMAGCSTFSQMITGIPAIPAHRVPPEFLGRKRTDMQEITLSRLRQVPPEVYQLAPNDVLGIYIENVLPPATEGEPEPIPVNFSLDGSKPPSLGYPVPVREDGTLALPLIDPISVTGLSLTQATDLIRNAYTVNQILPVGKDRIVVTLQRPREYRVLVVREESGASPGGGAGTTGIAALGGGNNMTGGFLKRGMGANVQLPAYENDLLSALNKTGGLPGLDAKNEVLIIRGNLGDGAERDRLIAQIKAFQDPCECEPKIPDDINITRIPLRFYPENVPTFTEEDIILQTGDIVMVQSREREQFYIGGAIRGGAFPLPRDYDIDIMQAIALAGGSVGPGGIGLTGSSNGGGLGGGGGNRGGGMAPSRAIVLRKTCNGGEIPIKVDLRRAITAPRERILIQPEDTIIVQYTCPEEIFNFFMSTISFNILSQGLNN